MNRRNRRNIQLPYFLAEILDYLRFLSWYVRVRGYRWFARFERIKDSLVDLLYQKRGRYTRPFLHLASLAFVFFALTAGPMLFSTTDDEGQPEDLRGIVTTQAYGPSFYTQQAEEVQQYRGGEIITHYVQEGDTLESIAVRYGLQVDTILWENNLRKTDPIKPGQELSILPIDGVRHKVARGETIYSIGKKYGLEGSQIQMIVDYPFNEFLNDETFELATGQYLMVPEGIKPEEKKTVPVRSAGYLAQTPSAGSVTAQGSFVWPTSGTITQRYSFYHKAIDIANRSAGAILAADSGTVVAAGWDNSGYGNRIMIDHGNGYVTLYGHLSSFQVGQGQTVNRGDVLGQMGSTGRSTGTHLHFEIRQGGVLLNPLNFLK
ncbi:M23 family metallopeptidase [Candidatus Woesebacteria bacterium]|nr:M23 family metallopeptidase [Candidatus Woesebacteria bacterium]